MVVSFDPAPPGPARTPAFDREPPDRPRRLAGLPLPFLIALAAATAAAAVLRAGFVLGFHQDFPLGGDAWVYHHEARFVANGRGFVSPSAWAFQGVVMPAADHPPLWIVILAGAYLLGIHTVLDQMLLTAAVGAATVAIIGVTARRLAGDRAGLVAAALAAVYPGLWSWNGQILSETLAAATTALTLLAAYRYHDRRRTVDLALLALVVGLACLSRGEVVLYVPFVLLALIVSVYRAGHDQRALVRHLIVAAAVVTTTLAPWTLYNFSRFREPVLLGTNFGRTLASGTCGRSWDGDAMGSWDLGCIVTPPEISPERKARLDESQLDRLYRQQAVHNMAADPGQVPLTAAARAGRWLQLFAPRQSLTHDVLYEGREWWVSGQAWGSFYAVAALAGVGAAALRRRYRPVHPLLVVIGTGVAGALVSWGSWRYRAAAEPAFVLLAAAGAEALARAVERRRAPGRRIPTALVGAALVAVVALTSGAGMAVAGGEHLDQIPAQPPPPSPRLPPRR